MRVNELLPEFATRMQCVPGKDEMLHILGNKKPKRYYQVLCKYGDYSILVVDDIKDVLNKIRCPVDWEDVAAYEECECCLDADCGSRDCEKCGQAAAFPSVREDEDDLEMSRHISPKWCQGGIAWWNLVEKKKYFIQLKVKEILYCDYCQKKTFTEYSIPRKVGNRVKAEPKRRVR